MRTLDHFVEIYFLAYSWFNKWPTITVPRCGAKSAFAREIQSKEISKIRHFCLLLDFMNVNKAKKMATFYRIAETTRKFRDFAENQASRGFSFAISVWIVRVCV